MDRELIDNPYRFSIVSRLTILTGQLSFFTQDSNFTSLLMELSNISYFSTVGGTCNFSKFGSFFISQIWDFRLSPLGNIFP